MKPKGVNLVGRLLRERNRKVSEEALMEEVRAILTRDEQERKTIRQKLGGGSVANSNAFVFDLLETGNIFHLEQIKAICIDYRLRFLDSRLFKNTIPEEAISKIKKLGKDHNTSLEGFKIMAPSKQFYLKNYDDPLLFVPIGNDYYYLVHKWGQDLDAFRKWLVAPVRTYPALLLSIIIVSLLFSVLAERFLFTGERTGQFLLVTFLFTFKSICGIALYYCFWKGKDVSASIWNSEYYNK